MSKELTCSRCEWRSPLAALFNLCPKCSAPILVHYQLDARCGARLRRALEGQAGGLHHTLHQTMWRYLDVLPVDSEEDVVTLGEGLTPMLPSRSRENVFIKDESKNPTRSFKSRGMAAAVSMAKKLGAKNLAAPTAGNAGAALAAYGARAGLPVFVAMPRDTPQSIVDECRGYGAEVELVAGVIA